MQLERFRSNQTRNEMLLPQIDSQQMSNQYQQAQSSIFIQEQSKRYQKTLGSTEKSSVIKQNCSQLEIRCKPNALIKNNQYIIRKQNYSVLSIEKSIELQLRNKNNGTMRKDISYENNYQYAQPEKPLMLQMNNSQRSYTKNKDDIYCKYELSNRQTYSESKEKQTKKYQIWQECLKERLGIQKILRDDEVDQQILQIHRQQTVFNSISQRQLEQQDKRINDIILKKNYAFKDKEKLQKTRNNLQPNILKNINIHSKNNSQDMITGFSSPEKYTIGANNSQILSLNYGSSIKLPSNKEALEKKKQIQMQKQINREERKKKKTRQQTENPYIPLISDLQRKYEMIHSRIMKEEIYEKQKLEKLYKKSSFSPLSKYTIDNKSPNFQKTLETQNSKSNQIKDIKISIIKSHKENKKKMEELKDKIIQSPATFEQQVKSIKEGLMKYRAGLTFQKKQLINNDKLIEDGSTILDRINKRKAALQNFVSNQVFKSGNHTNQSVSRSKPIFKKSEPQIQNKLQFQESVKRSTILKNIEIRNQKREIQAFKQVSEKLLKQIWHLNIVKQFLYKVIQKNQKIRLQQEKQIKFGQRISFMCQLIGKLKIKSFKIKLKIACNKLRGPIINYIHKFRERKMKIYTMQVQYLMKNFAKMNKMVLAGRILILKVNYIQKRWRKYFIQKKFVQYCNHLKWQFYEQKQLFQLNNKSSVNFSGDLKKKVASFQEVPQCVKDFYIESYLDMILQNKKKLSKQIQASLIKLQQLFESIKIKKHYSDVNDGLIHKKIDILKKSNDEAINIEFNIFFHKKFAEQKVKFFTLITKAHLNELIKDCFEFKQAWKFIESGKEFNSLAIQNIDRSVKANQWKFQQNIKDNIKIDVQNRHKSFQNDFQMI